MIGRVSASSKNNALVAQQTGYFLLCVSRSKKHEVVCGDQVRISQTGMGTGVIEEIFPRQNLLYRSDAFKKKYLAANITQIIFVLSGSPPFYETLLTRCLVTAEILVVPVLIILNKIELPDTQKLLPTLEKYHQLGYQVENISAISNCTKLGEIFAGHSNVMIGQSGVGKSTILNQLVPQAKAKTQVISSALKTGKHTTTISRWYDIDENTHLIDTPGVQTFGLSHYTFQQIEHAFVEFAPFYQKCHFLDCHHKHEPHCAIKAAVLEQKIDHNRYEMFLELIKEQEKEPLYA